MYGTEFYEAVRLAYNYAHTVSSNPTGLLATATGATSHTVHGWIKIARDLRHPDRERRTGPRGSQPPPDRRIKCHLAPCKNRVDPGTRYCQRCAAELASRGFWDAGADQDSIEFDVIVAVST